MNKYAKSLILTSWILLGSNNLMAVENTWKFLDINNKLELKKYWLSWVKDTTLKRLNCIIEKQIEYWINVKEEQIDNKKQIVFDESFYFKTIWKEILSDRVNSNPIIEKTNLTIDNIDSIAINNWFYKIKRLKSIILKSWTKSKFKKVLKNVFILYNEAIKKSNNFTKNKSFSIFETSFNLAIDMIGSWWNKIWCSKDWIEYWFHLWNLDIASQFWYTKSNVNYLMKKENIEEIINLNWLQFKRWIPSSQKIIDTCLDKKELLLSKIWEEKQLKMKQYIKSQTLSKKLELNKLSLKNKKELNLKEIKNLIMYATINTENLLYLSSTININLKKLHSSALLLYKIMNDTTFINQTSEYYKKYEIKIWKKYSNLFPDVSKQIISGKTKINDLKY